MFVWPEWLTLKRFVSIVVMLVLVIVIWYFWSRRPLAKKAKKTKSLKSKKPRSTSQKTEPLPGDEPDPEDETSAEDDLNTEAADLYRLVHERFCRGDLQSDEFAELAGELANISIFIDLKQIYNERQSKGLDLRGVTAADYEKVMCGNKIE